MVRISATMSRADDLNMISLHTLTNKMISVINMLGPVSSQSISCQSNATLIVFKHLEGTREFNAKTLFVNAILA